MSVPSNLPTSTPVEETVSGDQIKGLFSRPESVQIIIKHKSKKIEFKVRPMNNSTYAKMGAVMKLDGIDLDNTSTEESNNSNIMGLKTFGNAYFPAAKVVLPYCCLSPKVIDGISTDTSSWSIEEMPIDIMMELFNQIMKISGISEEGEEVRKN